MNFIKHLASYNCTVSIRILSLQPDNMAPAWASGALWPHCVIHIADWRSFYHCLRNRHCNCRWLSFGRHECRWTRCPSCAISGPHTPQEPFCQRWTTRVDAKHWWYKQFDHLASCTVQWWGEPKGDNWSSYKKEWTGTCFWLWTRYVHLLVVVMLQLSQLVYYEWWGGRTRRMGARWRHM